MRYDRLVPRDEGAEPDALFARCAAGGYRGNNVTYPYKEVVAPRLRIDDPLVAAIGSCNMVPSGERQPRGFNTGYSVFVTSYRRIREQAAPGAMLMIGAGGVGRTIAFGLIALGAAEIRLADRDLAKAEALAGALGAARPGLAVTTGPDAEAVAPGTAELINCTPVGMVRYEGRPLPAPLMAGAEWVFDAVSTPVNMQFLIEAVIEGLDIISGCELFIGQGVDAWAIFTGLPLDEARLRADLIAGRDA